MHFFRLIYQALFATLLAVSLLTTVHAAMGSKPSAVPQGQADKQQTESSSYSLADLHRAASSGHAITRIDAIQQIATAADQSSMDTLVIALQDEEVSIREMAAIGLARIGRAESVPALMSALQDEDARVRNQAGVAIVVIGPSAEAMEGFFQGMDNNSRVNRSAVRNANGRSALRGQGKKVTATAGINATGDESLVISKKVLRALISANPQMRGMLLETLNDANPSKRYAAAYALSSSNDPAVIAAFNAALANQDEVVISGAYEFYLRNHKEAARNGLLNGMSEFEDPDLVLAMSRSGDSELESVARQKASLRGVRLGKQAQ